MGSVDVRLVVVRLVVVRLVGVRLVGVGLVAVAIANTQPGWVILVTLSRRITDRRSPTVGTRLRGTCFVTAVVLSSP